ncbi:hypothetical protein EXIGLDRAFT_732904 [Exidia glandulosa HHB12029]|uniref:Uncharacterized protein n=1 Tax=Exidia glandulosa HHB12029 TaxID=1314781 RepID=A0A165PTQ2_EXIGL|nr:hypothetical protein EXIGLDRAFT_732904 [Exidia glandulosa HHB12029]
MSDALRRNSGTQRLLPNEYSRQLQAICGGHALWAPRRVENGGGSLGDAGYISQGSFYKEFNVYEDPPSSTTPLARPTVGVYMNEQFNMPIMQSSQESRVELRLKGSSDVVPLPLAVAPLSVEPSVVLQREKLAFLVPPMPARRDSLNRERRDEFCDWLSVNRHKIREDTILVTQAVRSSGWVGGVVTGKRTEVTGDVTADVAGVARMSVGASTALETVQMARIQGPDDWTPGAGANYTLIINFTMARSRMERLMHRLKVQISDLGRSDSPTPAKAAGPSAAPNRQSKAGGDVQTGSQLENLPVDALSLFDEPLSMAPESATRLSDWDNAPAHSASTSDDENDLTLLKVILDEVLDDNDDVDVAIADSSIITEFYEHQHAFRSGSHESSPTYLMDPVVTKRTIVSGSSTGPRIETIAFVESIQLKADSKQLTTD